MFQLYSMADVSVATLTSRKWVFISEAMTKGVAQSVFIGVVLLLSFCVGMQLLGNPTTLWASQTNLDVVDSSLFFEGLCVSSTPPMPNGGAVLSRPFNDSTSIVPEFLISLPYFIPHTPRLIRNARWFFTLTVRLNA